MKTVVSLVASIITITAMRMAGRGDQRFNYLGLLNCVVWTLFTVITQSWPLMILNVTLAWTYIGNIRRWKKVSWHDEVHSDMGWYNDRKEDQRNVSEDNPSACPNCGTVTGLHRFSWEKGD